MPPVTKPDFGILVPPQLNNDVHVPLDHHLGRERWIPRHREFLHTREKARPRLRDGRPTTNQTKQKSFRHASKYTPSRLNHKLVSASRLARISGTGHPITEQRTSVPPGNGEHPRRKWVTRPPKWMDEHPAEPASCLGLGDFVSRPRNPRNPCSPECVRATRLDAGQDAGAYSP
jgi:hypothetical protein